MFQFAAANAQTRKDYFLFFAARNMGKVLYFLIQFSRNAFKMFICWVWGLLNSNRFQNIFYVPYLITTFNYAEIIQYL